MSILGRDSIMDETIRAFENVRGVELDGDTVILQFTSFGAARRAKLVFCNQLWLESAIRKSGGSLTPNIPVPDDDSFDDPDWGPEVVN